MIPDLAARRRIQALHDAANPRLADARQEKAGNPTNGKPGPQLTQHTDKVYTMNSTQATKTDEQIKALPADSSAPPVQSSLTDSTSRLDDLLDESPVSDAPADHQKAKADLAESVGRQWSHDTSGLNLDSSEPVAVPKAARTEPVPVPVADVEAIRKTLDVLFSPGDIVELRILHSKRRTDAGYFDSENWDELAVQAACWNDQRAAVYVTINPVVPALLSRYKNRLQTFADGTTADKDIQRRRWLPLDFDAERPAGIASSDTQFKAAAAFAKRVKDHLASLGWPAPTSACSGNGFHLLYPVDLPNDDATRDLMKAVMGKLAAQFNDGVVKVDGSVFNAARIWKLYGTVANKGDHTDAAPWRLSKLLSTPGRGVLLTAEQMREFVGTSTEPRADPSPGMKARNAYTGTPGRGSFDLSEFLERLTEKTGITHEHDVHDGKDRYKLSHCPFNAEHGKGEAAIFKHLTTGALGFKCQHDSCKDYHWREVRELVDGPRSERARGASGKGESVVGSGVTRVWTLPEMLAEAVYLRDGSMVSLKSEPRVAYPIESFKRDTASSFNLVSRPDGRPMKVLVATQWMEHPERLSTHSRTFAPGQGVFCTDPDGFQCLNIWRPPMTHPRIGKRGLFRSLSTSST